MPKIIAAFLWDSQNKAISFMIIDHHYQFLQKPKKYRLSQHDFKKFQQKAEKVIKLFYHEVFKAYRNTLYSRVQIEYKILHEVKTELSDLYEPSSESAFVQKKFFENYALTKSKVLPLRLAKQLRARLKRPPLDIFKKTIRDLELVIPSKQSSYQYHLWILATHTTKSNYQKTLRRLTQLNLFSLRQ